jgi:hypothetical protein
LFANDAAVAVGGRVCTIDVLFDGVFNCATIRSNGKLAGGDGDDDNELGEG